MGRTKWGIRRDEEEKEEDEEEEEEEEENETVGEGEGRFGEAWGGESCVSQRGVVAGDRGRSTRTKRCNVGGTACRARVAKAKVCRVYKATKQRQSASSSLLDAPGISREQK